MIKLIATDMDDTLLNSSRNITPYTMDVLDRVRAKGVKFTICTGRMYDSSKIYVDMLKLTDPIIVYNGAMIVDPVSGKQLYHRPLENHMAIKVLELAQQWGCHSQIYLNDKLYTEKIDDEALMYQKHTSTASIATGKPLTRCLECPTTKIILIMNKELVAQRLPLVKEMFKDELEITVSKPEYLEFMDIRVNKGKTLAHLASIMGLDKDQIMAFGDARNDIPMLEYAGHSYAVANAIPEARAAAKSVCLSNDEDGVAKCIEQYVLK